MWYLAWKRGNDRKSTVGSENKARGKCGIVDVHQYPAELFPPPLPRFNQQKGAVLVEIIKINKCVPLQSGLKHYNLSIYPWKSTADFF